MRNQGTEWGERWECGNQVGNAENAGNHVGNAWNVGNQGGNDGNEGNKGENLRIGVELMNYNWAAGQETRTIRRNCVSCYSVNVQKQPSIGVLQKINSSIA